MCRDEQDEDNHALPFALVKVLSVSKQNENDRDDGEDDDESEEAPAYVVSIHEYTQTEINDGKPTGKCILHNEHGDSLERQSRIQKSRDPRRSLRKSQQDKLLS